MRLSIVIGNDICDGRALYVQGIHSLAQQSHLKIGKTASSLSQPS
jgi:hypothetical protein